MKKLKVELNKMKNDMKLIMESWKKSKILSEQAPPPTQDVTSTVFSDEDREALLQEYPGFDFRRPYPVGSYGAFVYTEAIASKLIKEKKEINKENILSTINLLATAGTQGSDESTTMNILKSVSGFLGMFVAATSTPIIANILAGAGAASFVAGTVNLFRDKPKGAEKFPALKVFNFDKDWAEILDDDIEEELLEAYIELFRKRVNERPEMKMTSIDTFINNTLKRKYNNRGLAKPAQQQTP